MLTRHPPLTQHVGLPVPPPADLCRAQVEDGAALSEFDGIADEADGIIFSRGNIGLDVAPEKMARVQKCAIALQGLPFLPRPCCTRDA